ncbi:uncharacterized protein G2W53_006654 [Senna tora]|uniref:Uncharacterized protein n=1 Tax=Senna tora TaxID=362788 RepID=A0A835CGN9_9FABA|nr:uncharacterized protein G2W53_006654 [Senna tora]
MKSSLSFSFLFPASNFHPKRLSSRRQLGFRPTLRRVSFSIDLIARRKPSRTSAHVAEEGVRHKQGNNSSLTLFLLCTDHHALEKRFNFAFDLHQLNRMLILKTSEIATIGALFNFSGNKLEYHEVQKNPPVLALCLSTKNCISTSENNTDLSHYAPPCVGFQVKALELKLLGGLHLFLPKKAEVEAARCGGSMGAPYKVVDKFSEVMIWILLLETPLFYIDPLNGYKFYSKPEGKLMEELLKRDEDAREIKEPWTMTEDAHIPSGGGSTSAYLCLKKPVLEANDGRGSPFLEVMIFEAFHCL